MQGEGLTKEISNEWSFNGDHSLKLTKISETSSWYRFRVSPSLTQATITVKAKVYSPHTSLTLNLLQYNQNTVLDSESINISQSESMQPISISKTLVENVNYIYFNFANNNGELGTAFYIDDVFISIQ